MNRVPEVSSQRWSHSQDTYIDDILNVFPLDVPGTLALKQSHGGPYPDSIGIKSEHRGKRVSFLDVSLKWRRPRMNKMTSKRQAVVLT